MANPDAQPIVTTRFGFQDGFLFSRYEATGGYEGLKAALRKTPQQVVDEVKGATLLGRGGAGFPAGVKWGFCPPGVFPRYLVVNGDESEPGTYKDRLLMERDPHQLIEGVLIACYAVGCSQAFLYVRGEMALAQERIAAALNDAYAKGYVGQNIMGTDFSVDIVLHWGAGAYIVGEETALIESLEGNRGMPRLKPPFFPAAIGLYQQPTIVNNVETLSNLPWIMTNGGAKFAALGAETSRGMRMFAVSGHVARPGVFEVEFGVTTFRDLIMEHAGGVRDGKQLKAFIPGGASAPWFYEEHLDLPLETGAVGRAGSMLGSGAIVVMDEDTDAVRACHRVVRFFSRESCGKCTPCREGTSWLEKILARIIDGYGRPEDLDMLLDISDNISPGITWPPRQTTICPLGPSAVSPIASALLRFRDEFERYVGGPAEITVPIGGAAYNSKAPEAHPMTAPTETVRLTVNGTEIEVPKGQLVIDAVEAAGVFIPRFCYHPRMKPVGMCRMCIVDIDTGRGPALQPSCMVNVADGMNVETESKTTKKAQDGVLEFLLVNHPLDCPVCDKGGECPLQDNAYAYGPGESRMVEEKRHVEKPIPVSGLVLLDRERCILCDRCTRFAKEVAGDPLIHFQGRGANSEVNTFPDHPFASYFSGNTVQICPVGALTAAPYRFKARPWDVEKAESTCTSCAVGCRVTVETSRNHVLRYQGVDIDPVNWGWLCDKGRFDFEAIESDDRLGEPLVRKGDELVHAGWAEALGAAAEAIRKAPADRIGVVGGSRLSNEAAYAWAKLAKGIIGTDNVDAQLGDGLPGEAVIGLPQATIDDACAAGSVIVMAGDLKEELPVLFLRLRDAVENRGLKLVEVGPVATGLTPYAAVSLRHRPGEAGEVVRALLHGTPGVDSPVLSGDLAAAQALVGEAPVVIYGRQSLAESPAAVVDAAAAVNAARPGARFLAALRRANARGAIDLGLAPGLLPGHRRLADGMAGDGWSKLPSRAGLDTAGILAAAAAGKLDVLVLLGADPLGDFPDHDLASRAIAGARTIVAVDTFLNDSSRKADVVLAAAGYAETAGTTTNFEGRISLLHQRVTPPGVARADWIIAAELAHRLGADLGLESPEDIWAEIEATSPAHAGITLELLRSAQGQDGVLAPMTAQAVTAAQGSPVWINSHHPVLEATTEAGAGDLDAGSPEEVEEAHGEAAAAAASEAVAGAAAEAAEAGIDTEPGTEGAEGHPSDHLDEVSLPANHRETFLPFTPPAAHTPPALDRYSLRLVATRKLYDNGTLVQHSPSLAGLSPGSTLRLNPADLERLGRASGDRVKVSSSRTSATLEAHADSAVPAGTAHLVFRQPGVDPAAFVDADQPVTDIRVETV